MSLGDNIDQGQNSPVNIVPLDILWGDSIHFGTSDWIVLAVLAIILYFAGSSIHMFYACCYSVSIRALTAPL